MVVQVSDPLEVVDSQDKDTYNYHSYQLQREKAISSSILNLFS